MCKAKERQLRLHVLMAAAIMNSTYHFWDVTSFSVAENY